MSALRLASSASVEISAPAELDSTYVDCDSQTPPVSRVDFTHPRPFIHLHQSPIHIDSGGLGTVLEEELVMLTREREEELIINEQDADLLSLYRQKERDLVLAAKLGKALLERNQELTKQYENMTKDLNLKLENLEQEKHELQQRLARREGEWESRVAELETDMQYFKAELEKHKMQLREANRDKTQIITELSEQNYSLLEQLRNASDVERQLYTQVHSLQDNFREKNMSKNQHLTQLESLQAEIKMLSEHKQALERCLATLHEENMQLKSTVDNLKEQTFVLEKICKEKDLQLQQSQLELQELCVSHQQLSTLLEEVTEEKGFQGFSSSTHSLLCEIEQSIKQEELKQEREQLRLLLWEVYYQIRSICSQLNGNHITDSALFQDLSINESSKTSSAKFMFIGKMQSSLIELRRLAQNLLDGREITGSHHGDKDVLKEQMQKLGEELLEAQHLYKQEQERVQSTQEEILQLHNQIALLSIEICSSREELRTAKIREPSELLQNAIRERDNAITEKNAVEMELAKCKVDNMSLNHQLLDALQQKFNLSQQLEAWQDKVRDQQEKHEDK